MENASVNRRNNSSRKAKLLITILWANFVFLWIRVFGITSRGDVADSFNYLGGLISAYGVIVTLWIYHNVRIYRKKGPRRAARAMDVKNTRDVLKRQIARKVDLKGEQEIVVDIIGGKKVFIHNATQSRDKELVAVQQS